MAKPPLGTFVLHDSAVPALPAGDYRVVTEHHLSAPKSPEGHDLNTTAETLTTHIQVSAPRFLLPGDQILSTFPPNQAAGAFSSRLPQIVLKRRTLPWERELRAPKPPDPPRSTPWIALVVLADAEGQLVELPVAQCVTPGVHLTGANDVTSATALHVTRTVVEQVFPSLNELLLLTHVREVDVSDTELAMGDDDGFLAVVMANRLPQPGIRYRACLISIEGQPDALPGPGQVAEDFDKRFVYADAISNMDELVAQATGTVDQSVPITQSSFPHTGATMAAQTISRVDAWSTPVNAPVYSATPAPRTVTATNHFIGELHGIDMQLIDPGMFVYTFPVLAHWTFSCTDAGDFRSLAEHLDVGMLGTIESADASDAPTVLDTGHVELNLTDRGGESRPIWYRGPLTPRPVTRRQPDEHGVLPLLHASDQARMIGPDGRENLSLATAFEIGRLLALSEPAIVAALLTWRKEGFNEARRAEYVVDDPMLGAAYRDDIGRGFAERAGAALIARLGSESETMLGQPRPIVDMGRPMAALSGDDAVVRLARGFGINPKIVAEMRDRPTIISAVASVPQFDPIRLEDLAGRADKLLHPLRVGAVEHAAVIAGLADGIRDHGLIGASPPAAAAAGDALDRLIARLDEEGGS